MAGPTVADGPMTGSHVHLWASGVGTTAYYPDDVTVICGSPSKLYSLSGASFTNISRGAAYSAAVGGWRFASVGNNIWATNWTDALQLRANNTGNFADGVASTFKPCPRFIVPVREHLVGANLSNAGRFQDEIVWSDADDPTNFDPAATGSTSTSIAGSKRLVSINGQITAISGGQYLLVFKRRCIYYGEYSSSSAVFNFDVLSTSVGTPLASSLIRSRYGLFFLGLDGFYVINGLSEPQKISTPGVEQFLMTSGFEAFPFDPFSLAKPLYSMWNEDIQMVGFEHPGLPLVGWTYRTSWTDYGNRFLILYNAVTQQWATGTVGDVGSLQPWVTSTFVLPYADALNRELCALTWTSATSAFARLSATGSVNAPVLSLNFRPVNVDSQARQKRGNQFGQSMLHGVLPVFSKTSTSGTALTESVTAEAILDPHGAPGTPEVRVSTERNPISGYYPFTLSGRFFRISIQAAAEDFANFEGVFVHFEELGPE